MSTKTIGSNEGFFWAGAGVIICLVAWQTGWGSFSEPGPGFIAFLTGLCMIGVGVIMIVMAVLARKPHKTDPAPAHPFGSVSWHRMAYATALLLVYAGLVERLGFILTTFLVLLGLFYDWNKRNWLSSLIGSCATTAISYLLLEKLLLLPLPPGVFG